VAPQLGNDSGIKLLDRIPDFHRHLCTTDRRGIAEWSTAYSLIVHTTGPDRCVDAGPFCGALHCLGSRFAQSCPQRGGLAVQIGNQ
jgi:hypothetical protein